MAATCAQHPNQPAAYQCDGCGKKLCGDCIEESHVLLLCTLCGERAMPLAAEEPATRRQLDRKRKTTAPYSFGDAMLYPFRGSGVYLYLATLVCTFVIWMLSLVPGCIGPILNVVLTVMIIGIQFRIIRTTSDGSNELPDWPDFTDVGGLVQDVATWVVIHLPFIGAVFGYMAMTTAALLVGEDGPGVGAFVVFILLWWVATAFMVMSYGAAGTYRRLKALAVPSHVRAFFSTDGDALITTAVVFLIGGAVFVAKVALGYLPFFGAAVGSIVGSYWLFVMPHLAGLIFRRHNKTMDEIYWSKGY